MTDSIATPTDTAALRKQLEPLQHWRTGPGACVCGFNAYHYHGIMLDYGEMLRAHLNRAQRGPTYEPLDRPTALALLDEIDALRAAAGRQSVATPEWAYTNEGHDDEYEYVDTFDCDGTLVAHLRRTPKRVVPVGEWERLESGQ